TRTFVSCHRQRLLLHPVLPSLSTPLYNAPSSYAVDLISNALDGLCDIRRVDCDIGGRLARDFSGASRMVADGPSAKIG
ncbi:hypothetical protein AB3X94_39975, partial [Paraburkholderia sp. BR10923]|uniref:hypothetical protein n=1 Tax=Paraburkholderia sp. BR10923 TaxID=3236992 RepID=UPI0034CDA8AD